MPNPFVHVEILCRSLAHSKDFYEGVFGWGCKEDPQGERFVVIDTGDSITGGLQEVSYGKPTGVTAFIGVEDIEATLKRVEAGNGRTVMARRETRAATGGGRSLRTPMATSWHSRKRPSNRTQL